MKGNDRAENLIDSISASYPTSTMTLIMPHDTAEDIVRESSRVIAEIIPRRNGRAVVHVKS